MKRTLYKDLLLWKESKNRKPLMLQGARQACGCATAHAAMVGVASEGLEHARDQLVGR